MNSFIIKSFVMFCFITGVSRWSPSCQFCCSIVVVAAAGPARFKDEIRRLVDEVSGWAAVGLVHFLVVSYNITDEINFFTYIIVLPRVSITLTELSQNCYRLNDLWEFRSWTAMYIDWRLNDIADVQPEQWESNGGENVHFAEFGWSIGCCQTCSHILTSVNN